jgi:hypothetical protein
MKLHIHPRFSNHFYIVLGAILGLMLIVFQGLYDWHVHQYESSSLASQPIITNLIDNAVNNLDKPAPVDAQTGQVFFPDVRLMLPAPDENYGLRQVIYADTSVHNTFELQVTTQDILNMAENRLLISQADAQNANDSSQQVLQAIFKQVPTLQACARGVQMFYSPQNYAGPSFNLQFHKTLGNGKTLYAYTEPTCSLTQVPAFVSYLKNIQSY